MHPGGHRDALSASLYLGPLVLFAHTNGDTPCLPPGCAAVLQSRGTHIFDTVFARYLILCKVREVQGGFGEDTAEAREHVPRVDMLRREGKESTAGCGNARNRLARRQVGQGVYSLLSCGVDAN